MTKPDIITVDLSVPGTPFQTDFFIRATLEIESFGSDEFIPPYNRPDLYDPGAGPDWSCIKVELWHDCGGDGEPVEIRPTLADHIKEFVESKEMRDAVEEEIAEAASDARSFADHCR